jgi:hypothetical protein
VRAWELGSLPMATFALLLGACGELDIVDHDPLLLEPEGNYPGPAEARCGPLPPHVDPIVGLSSAWVMGKVPVGPDLSFRAGTSSVVLRLSDDGVPCGVPLDPELIDCPRAWAVDVALRNALLAPGRHALGGDGPSGGQSWELATAHRVEAACVRAQERDTFAAGELEIFTVTDDCVVGRLLGTADELPAAASPVEGGFVALRCDAAR